MMGADFRPVTVRHRYNSRTYFAGKQLDALQASTAADPSEQAVYYVWVQEATGAPNSDYRVAIRVEIVYDVVFSELKKLGQS
jgi:hypothetical protein